MSFKENLLKKIKIKELAKRVHDTIGSVESGLRVDTELMAQLMALGGYPSLKERDLTLYTLEGDPEHGRFLVLDNDLAIYQTSVADIGLRKSPTVKEMLSIRNIKKILVDTDVVLSRKEESLKTIQIACIDQLDLQFGPSDIDKLVKEGAAAMESGDEDAVRETITLFAELLGYRFVSKPFRLDRFEMIGKLADGENSEKLFGPGIIFDPLESTLKWIDTPIGSFNKEEIEHLHKIAKGDEAAAAEGITVLEILKAAVLKGKD